MCNLVLFISTIALSSILDISTALNRDFINQSESLIEYVLCNRTEHSIMHIELSILHETHIEITYKTL